MAPRHVVWDWNGTLYDDFPLLVESCSAVLQALGRAPVSAEVYRARFRRPVQAFYEELVARPLTPAEWRQVDDVFHDTYDTLIAERGALTADASAALSRVGERGGAQSLLSMWRHERLVPTLRRHEIDHHFVRVDGLRGDAGGLKAPHLEAHLRALADDRGPMEPADIVLVGDTLDDAAAAAVVGVPCVLYAGGEHPASRLAETGQPWKRSTSPGWANIIT